MHHPAYAHMGAHSRRMWGYGFAGPRKGPAGRPPIEPTSGTGRNGRNGQAVLPAAIFLVLVPRNARAKEAGSGSQVPTH